MADQAPAPEPERITWQEFDMRHSIRYGKVMRGEMTVDEALRENEQDWRALVRTGEKARGR